MNPRLLIGQKCGEKSCEHQAILIGPGGEVLCKDHLAPTVSYVLRMTKAWQDEFRGWLASAQDSQISADQLSAWVQEHEKFANYVQPARIERKLALKQGEA